MSDTKNKLLVEQTRDRIFQYILDSGLEIGERIPTESELGERFDVGRGTVREAVKQLVSQGILFVKQGSGTYVTGTTRADQDPLGLGAVKDKMKLAWDLVNVRMMLEPSIAEMAAQYATDEDIRKLEELCRDVEEKINSEEAYLKADIAFHMQIAVCSKNVVLEHLVPLIDTAVMPFANLALPRKKSETIITHREVTEAIASKDPMGARAAMEMHIALNRNLIRNLREKEEK